MKVLVTGHAGYLGSVLMKQLAVAGHDVRGLDPGFYAPPAALDLSGHGDVRDLTGDDLRGFDAVVHLAALCNDACGSISSGATRDINCTAAVRLATLARGAGVERFVFASSCSMYGSGAKHALGEDGPTAPLTFYASSKLAAEGPILALGRGRFCPVALRFPTLYGKSASMRGDLLVNRLVWDASRLGRMRVGGDLSTWRPALHVADAGRSVLAVLSADPARSQGAVFNVGWPDRNHQLGEVVAAVQRRLPATIVHHAPDLDRRDYVVRFDKFAETFPGWRPLASLSDGIDEIATTLMDGPAGEDSVAIGWGHADRRLRLLWLREQGLLSADFRWTDRLMLHVPRYAPAGRELALPLRP